MPGAAREASTACSATVTISTGSGSTVAVEADAVVKIICDGTNVYNAASGSASSITSLTVGNGSLAIPAIKFIGDLNSGIYLPSTGTVGFVIGNAQVGYYATTGLTMAGTVTALGGVLGGTF